MRNREDIRTARFSAPQPKMDESSLTTLTPKKYSLLVLADLLHVILISVFQRNYAYQANDSTYY